MGGFEQRGDHLIHVFRKAPSGCRVDMRLWRGQRWKQGSQLGGC